MPIFYLNLTVGGFLSQSHNCQKEIYSLRLINNHHHEIQHIYSQKITRNSMKLSFNMDYVESPPPNSRWKKLPQSILNETNILRHNVLQLQLIGINDLSAFESNHVFNSMSNSFNIISGKNQKANRTIAIISCVTVLFICFFNVIEHLSSIRCFMPNNYLVWEATRPISNCGFCASVEAPLIFPNITQAELLVTN